jgi:hypothetical protein
MFQLLFNITSGCFLEISHKIPYVYFPNLRYMSGLPLCDFATLTILDELKNYEVLCYISFCLPLHLSQIKTEFNYFSNNSQHSESFLSHI